MSTHIPTIDPAVKYVGVSRLRDFNAAKLRETTDTTYVLQDNDKPLAVLIGYEMYLHIQQQLQDGLTNTLDMLAEPDELAGIQAGLDDIRAGRTRSFSQVKNELQKKHAGKADQKS